ncbi:MAG: XdhC family protein, partial [Desulfobacula sp.]|nr:XdhC family protein [Desulfobacula sp.]
MELLNQQILDCLHRNETFSIATIITNQGSTPRTSGSKMVVLEDKTIHGTVGGGLVEAMVIDACLSLMEQNRCSIREFTL